MIIKDSGSMTGQYHRRNISGRKSNAIVQDFPWWQNQESTDLDPEEYKIRENESERR